MYSKKFQNSKTYFLLKEAFGAECYMAKCDELFADIAQNEGLSNITQEFNELLHSQNVLTTCYFNILSAAGELFYGLNPGNTIENIKTALTAEILNTDRCVALIKIARDEGLENIAEMMEEISIGKMEYLQRLDNLGSEIV